MQQATEGICRQFVISGDGVAIDVQRKIHAAVSQTALHRFYVGACSNEKRRLRMAQHVGREPLVPLARLVSIQDHHLGLDFRQHPLSKIFCTL